MADRPMQVSSFLPSSEPMPTMRQLADIEEITNQTLELGREAHDLDTAEAQLAASHNGWEKFASGFTQNSYTADRAWLVAPKERLVAIRKATIARLTEIEKHDLPGFMDNDSMSNGYEAARARSNARDVYRAETSRYDASPWKLPSYGATR